TEAQRARIIWPSFLASSGVGTRDVPFRYGSQHPAVARWHAHPRSLATAIEAPCSKLQGVFEM
ncbi:MAG: hypothetical protein PVH75_07730, partial [Syntrophobacterales bacterium]